MKKLISRLVLAGAMMTGALAFSATPSAAVCMGAGGGTDCPLTTGVPLWAQPHQWENRTIDRGRRWARERHWDRDRNWDRSRRHHRNRRWDRGVTVFPVPVPVYRDYYADDYYDDEYEVRGLSDAHVRWCYKHYRSYRLRDNTFKPNRGPRRECRSPYS